MRTNLFLVTALLVTSITVPSFAQSRGMYASVDVQTGCCIENSPSIPMYDIYMSAGYRFCSQLLIYGSIGGGNYWQSETNDMQFILNARSELPLSLVSPFIEMSCGYSFQLGKSREPIHGKDFSYFINDGYGLCESQSGMQASIRLGMSWTVKEHRMNAGIKYGYALYQTGKYSINYGDGSDFYGILEYDPSLSATVWKKGSLPLKDRLKPFIAFSVGFEF